MVPKSCISDIVAPHIPYPTLFYLSHPISKRFGPKHPKSNKSCAICAICAFCLCLIMTFTTALSFPQYLLAVLSFRQTGRVLIDSFFVLIIYMFQEPRNIFWITSAPMCLSRGGGHIMLPVTRPETITIRHHPSGNNNCLPTMKFASSLSVNCHDGRFHRLPTISSTYGR